MPEGEIITETSKPNTRESIGQDLRRLGVRPGMTLIVHSSLRALGWVAGGPVAVVQALMDVVTEEGTIVMPAHTGNYSDPVNWSNPPVPQPWWETIYQAMPAFNPELTPSYKMGAIAEAFRTTPGVIRSNHPQVSFAAWGKMAHEITDRQSLEYGLGERSPLARIYDLNGWVLLLGVDYSRNTSYHLAEYRSPGTVDVTLGAPIIEQGQRVWKRFRDIELDSDIFPEIGQELELVERVMHGPVGQAQCRLFEQRRAVDHAVLWYRNRFSLQKSRF
jgi:aminoglycoside 3-N-acetyltransferase